MRSKLFICIFTEVTISLEDTAFIVPEGVAIKVCVNLNCPGEKPNCWCATEKYSEVN